MEKAGDGDHSAHREGAVRQFTLRRGEDGEVELPENCRDGGELVNVDERDGDNRTRFILCGRGDDDTPAGRAAMLERARERVATSEHLGEEQRARILAGLDAEIARLRAQ